MQPSEHTHGFVIVRHINNAITNEYWQEAYKCIRTQHGPTMPILIVDDNSTHAFVSDSCGATQDAYVSLIQSEYPGCGELLGYYYFWKTRPFEKAVIMHDSVFLQKPLDFGATDTCRFLWHFQHTWDNTALETLILKCTCPKAVEKYNNKKVWWGCFGVQSMITWEFLDRMHNTWNVFILMQIINTRTERMCIERIFALYATLSDERLRNNPSLFGIIHHYMPWGYTFQKYKGENTLKQLPIIKVWTGR